MARSVASRQLCSCKKRLDAVAASGFLHERDNLAPVSIRTSQAHPMSLNPQQAYKELGLESYPLSPMQKGFLFHHLEAPTPGAYIQQVTIELREELDPPLFRKAWQELIDRHAVLSTSFHWKAAGPPLQRVDLGLVVPWEEHDWSALPAFQRDDQLAQFLVTDLQRGFDMTQAPLLRLSLFRMDENEFSLVWTFHHILVDGRSRLLLLQEVFARYEALMHGSSLELPHAAALFRLHPMAGSLRL